MLSYNLFLLKTSRLNRLEKRVLLLIFFSVFLEAYDLVLYVGYILVWRRFILPPMSFYDAIMVFSGILALTQFTKLVGFVVFNRFFSHYTKNLIYAPLIIAIAYLALAMIPTYSQIGLVAIILFVFFRVIQGFAFGFELGFSLNFSHRNILIHNENYLYYFIIFAGEFGVFVSIVLNRFVIGHVHSLLEYGDIYRLQYFIGFLIIVFNVILRKKYHVTHKRTSSFGQKVFFYTLRNNWHHILLRACVLLTGITLLTSMFRIPNFLHTELHLSQSMISFILLLITVSAFLGSFFTRILAKNFSPIKVLIWFLVAVIVVNIFSIIVHENKGYIVLWLYTTGFFYGGLIQIEPLALYRVHDFHRKTRFIGRILSRMVVFTVCISLVTLFMDTSRFFTHNFYDYSPEVIVIIAAIISVISLNRYLKHFKYFHKET